MFYGAAPYCGQCLLWTLCWARIPQTFAGNLLPRGAESILDCSLKETCFMSPNILSLIMSPSKLSKESFSNATKHLFIDFNSC